MNAREFYNYCKLNGCIYSDNHIRTLMRGIPSFKRWEILSGEEAPQTEITGVGFFYNRVDREYLTTNFEECILENGRLVYKPKQEELNFSTSAPQQTATTEYFTTEEMARIERANSNHNLKSIKRYGYGDQIYSDIGVLKCADEPDDAITIGFEIETNLQNEVRHYNEGNIFDWFDYRLGHLERDSSITGVEFDSHIFTWKKLQTVKPLLKELFHNFTEYGFCESNGAGLHIHIGRQAFRSEDAFKKFYFLINSNVLYPVWLNLARRESNYAVFSSLENNNLQHLLNSIRTHRSDHSVAVNQQHSYSYEVRIFRTTLSTNILFGQIELLLNLVDFCNSTDDNVFKFNKILRGEHVAKMKDVLNIYPNSTASLITTAIDLSFISPLTPERLVALMQQALASGDINLVNSYSSQYMQLSRNGGAR